MPARLPAGTTVSFTPGPDLSVAACIDVQEILHFSQDSSAAKSRRRHSLKASSLANVRKRLSVRNPRIRFLSRKP